jgi:hypothetical protein
MKILKLTIFIFITIIVLSCINVIDLSNLDEITLLLGIFIIIINLNKNNEDVLEFFRAPMNYKMGEYSNVNLVKNYRRRNLLPASNILNKIKEENCSWMKAPCNEQLINKVYNLRGTGLTQEYVVDQKGLPSLDGNSKKKDMFMFAYNQCKPECCPSTYTCDNGCVCTTKNQRSFINRRGQV